MTFPSKLLDGTDPLYSPCTVVTRQTAYWACPRYFRDLGHEPARVRLPGAIGDGRDEERAAEARRLTIEVLEKYKALERKHGTWAWLIHRYTVDRFSPFQDLKENTRASYRETLLKWDERIGKRRLGLSFEEIKTLQIDMQEEGRSDSYVKRMFTMLRIVAGYGKALRLPGARDTVDVLSEMKFRSAPKRSSFPTRQEIRAIVDEADARGLFGFATGILIQWTYMLRAVDVRGQWLPGKGAGGIQRNGMMWRDGLTWDMIDRDLSAFEKTISKTERSLDEAMRFDLTDELRGRLRLLGNRGRVGPVIVSEKLGLPYTRFSWSQTFRRIRDDLGLPPTLWMMDTRAGAVTEASEMGVAPLDLRNAAQHMNVSTTDRYARARSESAAKVVRLRTGEGRSS